MSAHSNDTAIIHLGEDLECPLCFELFENARSLSCLHTFCNRCLAEYHGHQRSQEVLVCPICREATPLPGGKLGRLRPNPIVNRLTESWKRATECGHVQTPRRPSSEGALCMIHTKEVLTQYCCVCEVSVCRDCIIGNHRNHSFEELNVAVEKMKQDIKMAAEVSVSFLPKLTRAQASISETERQTGSLSAAASALEKEINIAADSALDLITDAIQHERNAKLAVVHALCQASNGELVEKVRQNATSTLQLAQSVIDSKGKTITSVDIANIYPDLRRKLGIIIDSSIEGGLLDNIKGQVSPTFEPNSQIVKQVNLGQLKYPASWRLARTFTLPVNRIGQNLSMRAFSNGRLAIGYRNGGIDIFDPINPGEHQVVLADVNVTDFSIFKDGTIAVVTRGKLNLFSPEGKKQDVSFNTPPTSGLMSVDVDESEYLIVGFSEHMSIHVYNRLGGDPTKTIDLGDFDPWKVKATTYGRIMAKNLNAIKVFDRTGKVHATISESPPRCTFATADDMGDMFAVVLRKKCIISVAKHSFDGSLKDIITKEQEVYKINNEKYWFGLAALSSNCVAVSDTRSVFIYRKIPVLPDLMKLAH